MLCLGIFLYACFSSLSPAQAATGINKEINFQGKVVNTDGTNVSNGSYSFTFSLYTVASGGANIWTETKSITVTNGVFQTNLGSVTALPGSVDFNTDNLYLGVNFNSDGEMTPRVRFTAAPYAFNALKVAGLTVTDTTGTLTIPNAKTIAFADAFATSGAFATTLTTTGTTNVTLPITGTLATLAGTEEFTNKTIGSTGLTFSGATTDITTASGESLILTAAGAGVIDLQDATTVDSLTTDIGGVSIAASQAYTGAGAVTLSSGGSAGLTLDSASGRVGIATGDFFSVIVSGVSGAAAGDIWYDSAAQKFKINENGTTKVLCNTTDAGCGSGGGSDLQTAYGADVDGNNATISLTAADDGLVFTNPTSGGIDETTFLLQLTQQNTTAGVVVLDMVQSSNNANGVNLTANSIDVETGLSITTNGLTSGKGVNVASSATAFTGNLTHISLTGSNVSNTGNVLAVSNTGTNNANTSFFVDHRATGSGNLALRINDEESDTTPFIVDGNGRVGIGTASISGSASTERLLQVGSETKRGNSATYGEVISKGLNRHTALANIKDIYVYDTTGDSDGGRWIDWATTDNLSWYSETLDDGPNDPCNIASDDRCYNSSFPRKAILVVTTDALYIFDAATNDMWMKFSQHADGYALGADTNNDPSSVHALNGVVYVGANGSSAGGLYAIDFVNDRMWNYNGTNRAAANAGISARNTAVSYNVDANAKLELSPVGTQAEWERVNDVHAVVMSRTQSAVTALGGATNTNPGYGKVFIGLATDSGVTVINPSGQVLNQYSDVTADDYTAVVVTSRGFLYALNTTQDQLERWDTIDTDKASEVNGTYSRKWDETIGTGPALASSAFNIIAGAPDNLEVAERASNNLNTEDVIYVGHSLGMAELHEHTTQAFGWVKYYNATRQTPMMMLAGINDMVLPLDDTSGTQAQDLAIANTDMAIKGTPTLGVDGVQGKAMNFDNTDDYLCSDADQNNTCDVDAAFNMSTVGWTISLWFKHSTTAPASGADTLFEKCVTATPGKATGCVIAYMTTTGTIVVANDDDATYTRPDEGAASYDITATSTYAYNDNQWHNLIITRTNANDVDSWIDGQGMNLSNATGNTITLDGSQIVSIGASCVLTVTANCGAVTNVWDGQIDDVQWIVGTTTQATMTQLYVRRYFNVERPRASKKTITVTNATSASSTSLTDTGEAWYVNEFAGQIVEITGSDDADCVGITRRISSNTATALTFTPAVPGSCTLDTSADFQVDPEKLYGASSSVAGIGITGETPLGEARQLCIGTNSGSDTGGVTCYNHQDGPSIVADVYHSQSSHTDDSGTDWAGTDYDDMRAVDLSSRTLVMASEGHFTSRTEDVRLGQGLEYISNQLYAIRQEIVLDGITAVGSMGSEIGFTGGADLAENYYSDTWLEAGTVVALDHERPAYVKETNTPYQKDMIGIVATDPGIVLGDPNINGYPVALVGRVPVKVTNENGQIYAGDRLTAATRGGYAMRAMQSGRVLGKALADAVDWTVCEGENPEDVNARLCTTVVIFVNLTDYYGQSVELAMTERETALGAEGLSSQAAFDGKEQGLLVPDGTTSVRLATSVPTKQEKILKFLKEVREQGIEKDPSEVFTGRVAASTDIITPTLFADEIFAKTIKADSIEGLTVYTNRIANLEAKYAGLETAREETHSESSGGETLLNLEQFTVGSLSVALDAAVLGKLSLTGGMTVDGEAEFLNDTFFRRLAHFFGKVLFTDTVSFEVAPSFSSDTAGFALIEKGDRKVRISFKKPYAQQPIVTATLTNEASPLFPEADQDLKADIAALEKEYLDSVFKEDVRYVVTEKSPQGFTIILAEKAPRDLQFSWVALAVSKAKAFESEAEQEEEEVESLSEEIPSVTPVMVEAIPPPTESIPATETAAEGVEIEKE